MGKCQMNVNWIAIFRITIIELNAVGDDDYYYDDDCLCTVTWKLSWDYWD